MRVADYIALRVVQAGISDVFMVTGGGAMHLNDAFARNKNLQVTCFHHEQAAAIAGEGYYRASGLPIALNVTTGPGGINALVGIYGAYVDSIPILVISGQVKQETLAATYPNLPLRQLGDQEVDIVAMVKPIVKYSKTIRDVSEVQEVLERAIFLMKNGRPGPVWIDIPMDIQGAAINELDIQPIISTFTTQKGWFNLNSSHFLHPNTILELQSQEVKNTLLQKFEEAIFRLAKAERPVILFGTGCQSPENRDLTQELLNLVELPIVTGWNALDLLPTTHKNFVGRPGTVGDRAGNFAVQNSDCILVLGCRLNIRQVSYNYKSFAKNAYRIMVDIDGAEMDKPTLDIDLKIQTNLNTFLKYFIDSVKKGAFENKKALEYRRWCKERSKLYPVVLKEYASSKRLNPYFFLYRLSQILSPEAIVATANGAACVMTFQSFVVKENQRIFTNSGCASMGYDVPAAIGAAIASAGKNPVICLAGDGSIMMNLQELQTIKGLNLPVKIIILNNGGYLSIKQTQQAYFPDNVFGTSPTNGLTIPQFKRVAYGFEIDYFSISSIDKLEDKNFDLILNDISPAIIEVFVDPEQGFSPKLASRKNDDGSMSSPELEDMAPFLGGAELAKNIF